MPGRWVVLLGALATLAAAGGLMAWAHLREAFTLRRPSEERLAQAFPADTRAILVRPEELLLYSLDPRLAPQSPPPGVEMFHGWRVLGRTPVADPKLQEAVVASLYDGIARTEMAAGCFNPRHGLRATRGGEAVDLVICFACSNFQVHQDGSRVGGGAISGRPKRLLDRLLADARVPLAGE